MSSPPEEPLGSRKGNYSSLQEFFNASQTSLFALIQAKEKQILGSTLRKFNVSSCFDAKACYRRLIASRGVLLKSNFTGRLRQTPRPGLSAAV